MIQVCSVCGTRWNVRDKQRQWCPRCQGVLHPPSAVAQPAAQAPPPSGGWDRPAGAGPPAHRLPPGFRWIAVRPGAAPTPHRQQRPLGPTPRYEMIPRWGLFDPVAMPATTTAPPQGGPSARAVRITLYLATGVMLAAAVVHAIRYLLLVINRTTLLPPFVALSAVWLGVLLSVAVLFAVIGVGVVMTGWLIKRRAAVYAHRGQTDPRSARAIWAGCLIPLVNLAWTPVFVIETATAEDAYSRMKKPILVWSLLWILCTGVSIFAIVTSFTSDAQGIADNHVTITMAYVLAAGTVASLARVYFGFERKPVERPAQRWVIVAEQPSDLGRKRNLKTAVEGSGQEPAA